MQNYNNSKKTQEKIQVTLSLVMTFRFNTKIMIHKKKKKIGKLYFFNIKKFCFVKYIVKRKKRQAMD